MSDIVKHSAFVCAKLDGFGGDNHSSSDEGKGVDKLHFVDFCFCLFVLIMIEKFLALYKGLIFAPSSSFRARCYDFAEFAL